MPFTFSNIYQGKLDSSNSMYFVLEWVAIFGEAKGILPLPKNCSHSLLSPQVNLDLFAHRNTSLVIEQICEDFIWCLVKFMKRVEPQSGRHKHFTAPHLSRPPPIWQMFEDIVLRIWEAITLFFRDVPFCQFCIFLHCSKNLWPPPLLHNVKN